MLKSAILSLTLAPLLAALAAVLVPLAFFTTTFALVALAARVLVVYLELFAALASNFARTRSRNSSGASSPSAACALEHALRRTRSGASRISPRASTYDGAGGSPTLPHNGYSGGGGGGGGGDGADGGLSGLSGSRDFEGIGGWRLPSADAENDKQWLTLNSRLELPAPPAAAVDVGATTPGGHHHRRSLTSGSAPVEKLAGGRRAWPSRRASREEEERPEWSAAASAGGAGCVKSMVALGEAGMNIGRARLQRRRESRSSGSSSNSASLTIAAQGGVE